MVVMRQLVFAPVLKALDARAAKTRDARRDAQALSARAAELGSRYDEEMAAARAKASSARAALRSEGLQQREAVVAEARAAAGEQAEATRAQVEKDFTAARASMLAQVDDLARQVAARLLGRGI